MAWVPGLGTIVHCLPSQRSTNAPEPLQPIAHASDGLSALTATSVLPVASPAPDATRVQALPLQRSIRLRPTLADVVSSPTAHTSVGLVAARAWSRVSSLEGVTADGRACSGHKDARLLGILPA
jgi:hypothetical protein